MNNRIGPYQLAPIFYAGLVWVCVGLFGEHQTTFLILGLLFMGMGLKRVAEPTPEQKPPNDPADKAGNH
ncbi:hypothetical protein ACFPAF_13880 [Hymenobacter endophyticus]|uniref:DMT family transporter n=1 Tax=Hymenobacter endophyticus TaxID=3076335 RepID=A0ABU3TJE4_9BACT|nr:hypothetical protein [Hymenobacter endophyticus]MDU0371491.1 hypothetical protein [Hymenobacter endophyticus]